MAQVATFANEDQEECRH